MIHVLDVMAVPHSTNGTTPEGLVPQVWQEGPQDQPVTADAMPRQLGVSQGCHPTSQLKQVKAKATLRKIDIRLVQISPIAFLPVGVSPTVVANAYKKAEENLLNYKEK